MKKIEMGKKYKAAQTGRTTVLSGNLRWVDGKNPHTPVAWESDCGDVLFFDPYGIANLFSLVEVSPYADIPIDTPGWARDGARWFRCHFADIHLSGLPMVWDDGKTSFTTEDQSSWDEFTTTKPEGVE